MRDPGVAGARVRFDELQATSRRISAQAVVRRREQKASPAPAVCSHIIVLRAFLLRPPDKSDKSNERGAVWYLDDGSDA